MTVVRQRGASTRRLAAKALLIRNAQRVRLAGLIAAARKIGDRVRRGRPLAIAVLDRRVTEDRVQQDKVLPVIVRVPRQVKPFAIPPWRRDRAVLVQAAHPPGARRLGRRRLKLRKQREARRPAPTTAVRLL